MKPDARKVFEVVPYAPDAHGAFVRSTWANGALRDGSRAARAKLDELLALPGSRAVLAHIRRAPDKFGGWAARTPNALIFAFVVECHRGYGLANMMVRELGDFGGRRIVDERPVEKRPGETRLHLSAPLPLMHWTPSARDVAAAGKPVYYAPSRGCACAGCALFHSKDCALGRGGGPCDTCVARRQRHADGGTGIAA